MEWVLNLERDGASPYSTTYCYLTSLSLSFLITKMGIKALTLQDFGEKG